MLKNKKAAIKCLFPKRSVLIDELQTADYYDSYRLSLVKNDLNPLAIYLLMVNNTPSWINALLSFRNKLMSIVGLKNVGNLGELDLINFSHNQLLKGTKLDIFTIDSLTPEELILILNDRHLDINMSILIQKAG